MARADPPGPAPDADPEIAGVRPRLDKIIG